ncbi:hypothetical protein LJ737_07125 [Hymenobacter sp. 15J16-1T3B]|uniref:hypothetical protein n=1 Tax=Hymenobacter sp. 15J16-1T3B TaxID=2886941 RepID=UPI001D0F5627|nr:hypothetical protein [Hymenobacter sp. 15J16-1T3B]MCC3157003.1 hypothetical protein [Hymenobacter sp. 15J16-1T3B]
MSTAAHRFGLQQLACLGFGLAVVASGTSCTSGRRISSAPIEHGVLVAFDTISVRDLAVGDTLRLSYAHDWPHECLAVVREPQTVRAYWYRYQDPGAYVPIQFADTAARFYARNRGKWQELARSTVAAGPALDSLQTVLAELYGHRSTWINIIPKVYYLQLATRRSYVRDQSARLRSEQTLRRILQLTVPPAAPQTRRVGGQRK